MKKLLTYIFPLTVPILAGYIFLGLSYGIFAYSAGISPWIICLMSLVIYSGTMQFATVGLLNAPFDPIGAIMLTIMVSARMLFYGVTLLKPYNKMKHPFKEIAIFGLTDEAFSIAVTTPVPPDLDPNHVYAGIAFLNYFYWFIGSILGVTLGQIITVNTEGIEFVLTALFVTLFVEQWLSNDNHQPALVGLTASILCWLILGPTNFMIPAMVLIVAIFVAEFYRKGDRINDDQ